MKITDRVKNLLNKEAGYKEVAEQVYGSSAIKYRKKVAAIASKLRRRGVVSAKKKKVAEYNCILRKYRSIYEQLRRRGLKAERKEDRFAKVKGWSDLEKVIRQVAQECDDSYRQAKAEGRIEAALGFLEYLAKFVRLSQWARKEFDLEEIRKEIHRLKKLRKADSGDGVES